MICCLIGILVSGSLKCIGTSQHLKTRFGRGLQIDISTGSATLNDARNFMLSQFPGIQELEFYGKIIILLCCMVWIIWCM